VALLVVGFRRARKRRRQRQLPGGTTRASAVAIYGRLLAILERRCRLRQEPAETPREFAEAAEPVLGKATADPELAAVPRQVVRLYYRVRYGQYALSSAEQAGAERQLDQVDAALAQPANGTAPRG
jgi:hypothetical protein